MAPMPVVLALLAVAAMQSLPAQSPQGQRAAAQSPPPPKVIHSPGNPILADGRFYSTDPAPFVDGDTLWILAGRDEAPVGVNDFIMNEWQLLATTDPAHGVWQHYPDIARPETVFPWAEPGRAYAGQIVRAGNGRYYLYAPVLQRESAATTGVGDRFAIGVAVADRPTGPWHDAHPAGPIVSQTVPIANAIQNIDPTVLVDDDGRVFLYWGTFGQLRGMELAADMMTPAGGEQVIRGATGFFEAPWLMKRRRTYYLLYAANTAAADSACTPAVYHACQAYATAPAPLGPWTYRGVLLRPVSSTTSHAGAVAYRGRWYLAYHNADARDGGHFRRSVALDEMTWDDTQTPPAIRLVTPTRAPGAPPVATRNVAAGAGVTASNLPVPVQYWIAALNDGVVRASPLPPDMWGTWSGKSPASAWVEYRWPQAVTLNASRIRFFADRPAGSGEGVAPPAKWHLEYWQDGWKAVTAADGYRTDVDRFVKVRFPAVTTRCLRAVFTASGASGAYAGMAVQEWEALAPIARMPPKRPAKEVVPCGT